MTVKQANDSEGETDENKEANNRGHVRVERVY